MFPEGCRLYWPIPLLKMLEMVDRLALYQKSLGTRCSERNLRHGRIWTSATA